MKSKLLFGGWSDFIDDVKRWWRLKFGKANWEDFVIKDFFQSVIPHHNDNMAQAAVSSWYKLPNKIRRRIPFDVLREMVVFCNSMEEMTEELREEVYGIMRNRTNLWYWVRNLNWTLREAGRDEETMKMLACYYIELQRMIALCPDQLDITQRIAKYCRDFETAKFFETDFGYQDNLSGVIFEIMWMLADEFEDYLILVSNTDRLNDQQARSVFEKLIELTERDPVDLDQIRTIKRNASRYQINDITKVCEAMIESILNQQTITV